MSTIRILPTHATTQPPAQSQVTPVADGYYAHHDKSHGSCPGKIVSGICDICGQRLFFSRDHPQ